MSAPGPDPRPMRDRVLDAIDPQGQVRQNLEAAHILTAHPALREVLKASKLDLALVEHTATYNHLLNITARATQEFSMLGWAPSSQITISAYDNALQALDAGDPGRAEVIIAESWDDRITLRRLAHLVSRLGLPDHKLNEPFKLRAELLFKAVDHHVAGAFEASVPILLAQCEGLVADVSGGKMFFSRGKNKADIVPGASIATMDEALPVVRELFSRGMDYSAATGDLRRHGILHGRELGYHTRLNSLKCFVLLQALIEWADPLIAAEAERRRVEGETQWTGSDEVDERGRRRDRREFTHTCGALQFIAAAHMGWYSPETGYDRRVLDMMTSTPVRQLKQAPGITMHISDDNQSWWAWRQTVTGWVFGVAGVGGPPSDLFFDGPTPPQAGPVDEPEIWSEAAGPNWSSR